VNVSLMSLLGWGTEALSPGVCLGNHGDRWR